jgi:hypothetical protein
MNGKELVQTLLHQDTHHCGLYSDISTKQIGQKILFFFTKNRDSLTSRATKINLHEALIVEKQAANKRDSNFMDF